MFAKRSFWLILAHAITICLSVAKLGSAQEFAPLEVFTPQQAGDNIIAIYFQNEGVYLYETNCCNFCCKHSASFQSNNGRETVTKCESCQGITTESMGRIKRRSFPMPMSGKINIVPTFIEAPGPILGSTAYYPRSEVFSWFPGTSQFGATVKIINPGTQEFFFFTLVEIRITPQFSPNQLFSYPFLFNQRKQAEATDASGNPIPQDGAVIDCPVDEATWDSLFGKRNTLHEFESLSLPKRDNRNEVEAMRCLVVSGRPRP